MALLLLTWDLPPPGRMESYTERARSAWIPSVLRQPGVRELRAYRNATQTRPDVLTFVEFDDAAAVAAYIASQQYATVISGLRFAGCENITAQVWSPSPVAPEPLKPLAART